ncbi:toxin HicA [Corynebacterium occultum]|uniref:toxin HicA n=1 Tax=Corynebacterium occultum TaxID=2675219 RepID=UPI001E2E99D2|nr:toxin HicA [Corynebacterium occultum]
MGKSIDDILKKMRNSPTNIRFSELEKVCDHFFDKRPSKKTSHQTYKTPWIGNPRVNIQNDGGKAKAYQVSQVLEAVDTLKRIAS